MTNTKRIADKMSDSTLRHRSARKPTSGPFRPEIEGLRSVAFVLVAVFHIWFNRVSGGVDVFFTVAGFLITVTLLGHVDRSGRVRARKFFARLATRLLPQSILVLLAVLVLTILIRPFSSWRDVFQQVVASATYWENWFLAFNSIDYLAVDTSKSPVQHFWAMSIQGQFYLLWFGVFALMCLIARRYRGNVKRMVFAAISLLAVTSFIWSLVQTASDQQFAYFSTLTRVWEFGLGALVALVVARIRVERRLAAILSWLALAAIVSVGILLPVADSFPGYTALIPVLAACVIIITGRQQSGWGANSVLASRPLVWLGGLGYGVYLWHWPMLVFVLEVRGIQSAGLETGLVVIIGSVLLAWVTKKFVEDPVLARRSAPRRTQRAVISATIAAVVAVAGLGIGGVFYVDEQARLEQKEIQALESNSCFGASAFKSVSSCEAELKDLPIVPGDPSRDYAEIFDDRCATGLSETDLKPCVWGDTESDVRIALVGNSHAAVWFPAYRAIADRYGWRLDTYFKHGCTFNNASRELSNKVWQSTCDEWVESLNDHLAEVEPYSYLLTSASAQSRQFVDRETGDRSVDAGIAGYQSAWQPVIDRGTILLAMQDYPYAGRDLLECGRKTPSADCAISADSALVDNGQESLVAAAETLEGAVVIDMRDWFCVEGECPAVVGNVQVYRDESHITETYARSLTAPLVEQLQAEAGFPSAAK